jgi:peptide/nickel transport system permease protein
MTRRVLLAVLTLWVVSVLAFVIIVLPPGGASIDRSIHVQYFKWMGMVLGGRFGFSSQWDKRVFDLISERLAMTMVISLAALLLAWVVALPVGIYSAVRQYSITDYAATVLGLIGVAVPNFLLALVVTYLAWRWLDADIGGLFSREYANAPWSWAKFVDLLKHLPIPILILGFSGTAILIRIMRANLLDELPKPYVMAARARGLSETRVILKYPVRVSLNPFASTAGYMLPQIVSGTMIVALVLNLPTVGPLLLTALLHEDMYLAGTIVLLLSALTIVGTLLSDLLLMWIDPRIRMERRS